MKYLKILILATSVTLTFTNCRKTAKCYDEQLYQLHKNDACTADCPGVVGCDGKTYCNECEANRLGIRVDD